MEGDSSAPLHRLVQAHTSNASGKALFIPVLRHLWDESSLLSVSTVTKDWFSKFTSRQCRDGETRVNGYIPCHNGRRHMCVCFCCCCCFPNNLAFF